MREILKEALKGANIALNDDQIESFIAFYKFLIETNKKFNLTRIVSEEEYVEKHVLDSLSALPYIEAGVTIVDVGSGGGFPGIPLKIARPDLKITMIDSVSKKVDFLNEAIEILGLENAIAVHARAEDFAQEHREAFDVCVSRAVAPLSTLLEYCSPLTKIGGKVIAYKGSSAEEELNAARKAIEVFGLELGTKHSYQIQERNNNLLIFKKERRTPNLYPRRNNKPRKEPI